MYEIFVGLRFIKAGNNSNFINFISFLSTAGIALGVATLIIVLSVMNGFQKEVRDKMLGVLAHVELITRNAEFSELENIREKVSKHPDVVGIAPFIDAKSILLGDGRLEGVFVKGIDPDLENEVSDILKLTSTSRDSLLPPGSFNVFIGKQLADKLALEYGDSIILISTESPASVLGFVPRIKKFKISGIFDTGHFQYDSNLIVCNKEDVKKFFRYSTIDGLRIRLNDMNNAPSFANEIKILIGDKYIVRDWTYENKNWFAAVQIEKKMMTIILMLIIGVAAFNLVSMLVMTVSEKKSDIAILRTMGATKKSILLIFFTQGICLGLIGVFSGLVLGSVGALNVGDIVRVVEVTFGFEVLPEGIYLIDKVPSDLRLEDMFSIGVVSLFLTVLSTIYPCLKAMSLEPAAALRYE
ncbi:MAG: hypothetical protein CBC42_00975 [Betaproteobacteria bacterium TMED82]|nr:MAG: hypothetical protein CBC42_00975 [Betaproteobacteria bacterium TMED82]|tara:strand:+ start:16349 stop:17584 length:1236 start_codon:yes stop_codon:yes gene_type:complete